MEWLGLLLNGNDWVPIEFSEDFLQLSNAVWDDFEPNAALLELIVYQIQQLISCKIRGQLEGAYASAGINLFGSAMPYPGMLSNKGSHLKRNIFAEVTIHRLACRKPTQCLFSFNFTIGIWMGG